MFRDKTRDFRNKKLTVDEAQKIKAAFDAGVAMCFQVNKDLGAGPRIKMASSLLEAYSDVILAKCDYVLFSKEPKVFCDMILLVKKDTEKEAFNKMVDEIIIPSGIVSEAVFIGKTGEQGVKKAVKREFANDKPCIVKKANLLLDGEKLILTVRA
jgi:hypothetical protein